MDDLADLLRDNFDLRDVVLVSGAAASWEHGERLSKLLQSLGVPVREIRDPDGSTASVTKLLESLDQQRPTLVVAFGGGRPIDVAKLASSRARVDLVVVPTVLSHDGMCSPVASLVAGDQRRRSLPAVTPTGIIVDTTIVGAAPERYLRAGVGDLVSNVTAVEDWRLAAAARNEPVDQLSASMSVTSALSVLDIDWPPDENEVATIARGLILSGLAMEIAHSSRPCSGAEHLVSHAIDELMPDAGRLHGEQVALGTLIVSQAQETAVRPRIVDLFGRMGFPTGVLSWGWSREELLRILEHAPSTRPNRYTVFDELGSRGLTMHDLLTR